MHTPPPMLGPPPFEQNELAFRYYNGLGRVPLRMRSGRYPYTKPSDPQYRQPILVGDGEVLQLDMGVQEDREKLATIVSWHTRGALEVRAFRDAFCEKTGNFKVFIIYARLVHEDPQEVVEGIRGAFERREF